jgi:hypothetical protein
MIFAACPFITTSSVAPAGVGARAAAHADLVGTTKISTIKTT